MKQSPEPAGAPAEDAEPDLARLQGRVESMRSLLIRLLQEVVRAESRLDDSHAAQLLAVNEHLVVSALNAQADADSATKSLNELSRSAELDALTQLPNRVLLRDRFVHAIATARRHGGRLALLFLDLDGFKQVNDTLGHAVGDQVLQRVARCLSDSVRAADTVSRHGGDEFLILLTEVSQPSDAGLIAAKMIAAIGASGMGGDQAAGLTASIGISLFPDDGEDTGTLIARADAAMYDAKRHGPGNFAFHAKAPAAEPVAAAQPSAPLLQPPPRDEPTLAAYQRRNAHLREANQQLLLAVLSAQELQAAAEQAQRRQTEFTAMVAHELRNPLAPIRIATALLGRVRTDEPLLPRVQAIVERQMAQISSLVGDLLKGSRADAGMLKLESQPVDMARVIVEAVDAWQPVMDARHQHFEVHLPAAALELQGDAVRLGQLVGNMLDNASNYALEGGEIELAVVLAGADLVLTVSDNGVGITPQDLPNVFDSFVQDTHAMGLNDVGPGIGLTVVRALAEAHGGTVAARSAGRGLGSQFVVTLPLRA